MKRTFVHYFKERQLFKEAHRRLQLIASKSIDFELKEKRHKNGVYVGPVYVLQVLKFSEAARPGEWRVKCCIWFRDWMQLKGTPNGIDTKLHTLVGPNNSSRTLAAAARDDHFVCVIHSHKIEPKWKQSDVDMLLIWNDDHRLCFLRVYFTGRFSFGHHYRTILAPSTSSI